MKQQEWDEESLDYSEDEEIEDTISKTSESKPKPRTKKKTTRFKKMLKKISVMDIVIAFVAVIIVISGIVIAVTLSNKAKIEDQQEAEIAEITGMYGNDTQISIIFISYCKDLKIKFTNKATGELITKVDFDVNIKKPSGEEVVWTDEDEDGIIYQSDLESGNYEASMISKDMFKYSTNSTAIVVKDTYDYQKVDILNEALAETSVDKSIEDIMERDAQTKANALTSSDTVEWVEATKVEIPYVEVEKSSIINPESKLNLTITQNTDNLANEVLAMNCASDSMGDFAGGALQDEVPETVATSMNVIDDSDMRSQTDISDATITSFSLEPLTLKVGEKKKISKTIKTSDDDASVSKVTYEYSLAYEGESCYATVDSSTGMVTGISVGDTGTYVDIEVNCKATLNGVSESSMCTVRVEKDASETSETTYTYEKPVFSSQENSIKIGESLTLLASVKRSDGATLYSNSVNGFKWSVDNASTSIISVDSNGNVKGLSEGTGTVNLTFSEGTFTTGKSTIRITVTKVNTESEASKITVTPDKATIDFKNPSNASATSVQLTANVTLNSGSDKTVEWKSSDTKIATVDSKGKVTGVGTGTATITATTKALGPDKKALSATAKITVNPFTMKIDRSAERILIGKSFSVGVVMTNYPTGSINWTSSNNGVATVSGGVITGVGAGTATISATSVDKDASGKAITASCSVTVLKAPQSDNSSALVNSSGKQIYIKQSNGEYVKATYADYYKGDSKYYVTTNNMCEYTGWQTIDGKTYYYGKDKKAVTGTQIIHGIKYNFDESGALQGSFTFGTDVSSKDGSFPWDYACEQNVKYAMIRCGYRGAANGKLVLDEKCYDNISAAKNAGLSIGLYFETQATNTIQAIDEASMAVAIADQFSLYNCKIFIANGPSGSAYNALSVADRTAMNMVFCQTVNNSGYSAGVYASSEWMNNQLKADLLSPYSIWIGEFGPEITYNGKCDMWQQGIVSDGSNSIRYDIWFEDSFGFDASVEE